ncbi:MAG TPA: ATPase, T2SS/T4P/T4SS family [Candidatus Binatia bacterium]|nr:ATPase, T2SS/T4P/T4SS family [Candidatus Binatia bacterium]
MKSAKKKAVHHVIKHLAKKAAHHAAKPAHHAKPAAKEEGSVLEQYSLTGGGGIPVTVTIRRVKSEFVPVYHAEITNISENTQIILEKIRQALIRDVNIGVADITDQKREIAAEERYGMAARQLIEKAFPDASADTINILTTFLLAKSLGLGTLEILRVDPNLEEIAINSAAEPVWVFHRTHGWCKTNIQIDNENLTKHYASMIGRRVGRQITVLEPMMDANLSTGERFNATLMPISNFGNTITLRKFAAKPWTITDFITSGTISAQAAALIWEGIQYELSMIIVGGTASGKTSLLNVVSNFFPPNQRIISIEDTRELKLPTFLHWMPMTTRFPNNEGKGGVTMLNLLVNALRQRPDRILVGEIRRREEAEVLFEAIHTGHSVYATLHANDAAEAVTRLTNPPIDIPKHMLPAVSLFLVQHRNRRTGHRRVFQIAEVLENATANVLMQWEAKGDKLKVRSKSHAYVKTLQLFTGISNAELKRHLKEKEKVLNYLVKNKINTVDGVGKVVAEYYLDHDAFLKSMR